MAQKRDCTFLEKGHFLFIPLFVNPGMRGNKGYMGSLASFAGGSLALFAVTARWLVLLRSFDTGRSLPPVALGRVALGSAARRHSANLSIF